ncbi:peptide deformylase [Candidatus Bathyarchaeota archaeon]|nr:peptide deformylase [Candidatus Bathyarchaeota archaeon]
MTVRDTVLLGDPLLREVSEPVTDFAELKPVLDDLKDTLTDAQGRYGMGRGMAAPQVGHLRRVVYIQMPDRSFYLVNPVIEWRSDDTFEVWDSCFSLEAAFFVKIPRNRRIRVRYMDEAGAAHVEEFSGDMSELLQHEIDHLDGVVCSDHLGDPRDIVMRAEWVKRYRTPGVGM